MTLVEKIIRLQELRNLSMRQIELRAGITANTLARSIEKYADGLSEGVRLARVLGVPAEWLFDDEQDWPPPMSLEPADPQVRRQILAVIAEACRRALMTPNGAECDPQRSDE